MLQGTLSRPILLQKGAHITVMLVQREPDLAFEPHLLPIVPLRTIPAVYELRGHVHRRPASIRTGI